MLKKEAGMENRKIKFNNNLIYLAISIIVILMLVFGRRGNVEIKELEESLELEEASGSGFLEIKTFPSDADIYVDRLHSGKSPITLYDIPAGSRDIAIKKEGYEDFTGKAGIEAGKKTYIEANLAVLPADKEKEEIVEIGEEKAKPADATEEKKEGSLTEAPKDEKPKEENKINLGSKFTLYYDFSDKKFTDIRDSYHDVFSKRYKTYLVFIRSNPTGIKAIGKSIDNVKKEDCAGIKGSFEYLYSGQSLCVITKENSIAAIGGKWENTENAELEWKLLS